MTTNTAPTLIAGRTGNSTPEQFLNSYGIHQLKVLPDGRLVGSSPGGVTFLNADGTFHSEISNLPDLASLTDGAYNLLSPEGFKLLPNGKVVIGGDWYTYPEYKKTGYLLYRLNSDGSLDKTFAKGQGWVSTNPGDYDDAAGMVTMPDGKFVVIGTSSPGHSGIQQDNFIAMSRFTADGEVDHGFGDNGTIRIADKNVRISSVAVQSDGKILAAGSHTGAFNYDALVYRFNPDGSPDASFGSSGSVSFTFGSYMSGIKAIAIQPDGKIVTASTADATRASIGHNYIGVTRLNPDGTFDATFGVEGKVLAYPGAPLSAAELAQGDWASTTAASVLVRQDGSIVVGGSVDLWKAKEWWGAELAMTALRPNGEIDTTFGNAGRVSAPARKGSHIYPEGLVELPDGRLFLSGGLLGNEHLSLHSFNADGTPDLTIGAVASGSSNSVSYKEGHAAVALNSAIILHDRELAATNYQGASLELQRHGAANASDLFEARGKLSFAGGNVSYAGVVLGSVQSADGKLRIEFNANATEALVNQVLRNIAYRNTADLAGDASVTLDWTFSDGGSANDALGAKASTTVQLIAGKVAPWIEQLLNSRDSLALKDDLRYFIGPEQTVTVAYISDGGAAPLSQAEKDMLDGLLASMSTVSGIKWTPDSQAGRARLEIHSSAEIPAGKIAFSALADNSGALYIGKPAGTTISGMLPEINKFLMRTLGLDGDTTLSTNADALHIAALQYLYGPNSALRSGNDSYRLNDFASHMLWDGAGIDTIDGSGLAKDLVLHLEAGHWDHIGGKGAAITGAGQITVNYGSVFENATGGSGNDQLFGTTGANILRGGAGNDVITGYGGDDSIDGGSGRDLVNFAGKRAEYAVRATPKGYTVSSKNSIDTVTGVERLHFADGDKALDIDGNAGQLFRLYQAIFNRKPDEAGLGYWLKAVDAGLSMESVALEFTRSAEFARMYGSSTSNKDLLTRIYEYALHRQPDNDGFAWWLDVLDQQKASLGTVLIGFSESKENYAQVIGSIQNGIDYLPYSG
ncbi:DUF4214 domain-containing protein [Pseudoduganella sp.]|uniref:DUF4214 domain-containing protein n=1 Tax=Pseudoduganella sp. TaxID=1880898 RepID=UPI0035B2E32B